MDDFFKDLSKKQVIALKEQIERFKSLSKRKTRQIIPKDEPIFKKNTLIHGTSFNIVILKSISKSGIVTGQYLGIEEDGETYFCADFHKVPEDTLIKEYNNRFPYRDGRCPFGNLGKNTIAFIINDDPELEELRKYDCYQDNTEESTITKSFVNENGLPIENKELASSILFGIPASFINGIVVGDNVINSNNIKALRRLFPQCYLVRNNGQIICKQNDKEELIDYRIKYLIETIDKENLEKEIKSLHSTINNKEKEIEKLWIAISKLPQEEIAKVYETIGWQGDYMMFASQLQEKYKVEGEKKR